MRISAINSPNFRGLWELTKPQEQGQEEALSGKKVPVYYREAIYHPFSDETAGDIIETLSNNDTSPVHAGYFYNKLDHFMITKHKLGERLDVSESQYNSIAKMHQESKPSAKNNPSGYSIQYETSKFRSPLIAKTLQKNAMI